MLEIMKDREKFANEMLDFIKERYDLSDTQIFIFGSFLTQDFVPAESDIDIGVYSENETKMYDIKNDLSIYLDNAGIEYDIVIMHLNENLWINIPILTYGKPLTPYEDDKLADYLLKMVEKWGFNPLDKIEGDM